MNIDIDPEMDLEQKLELVLTHLDAINEKLEAGTVAFETAKNDRAAMKQSIALMTTELRELQKCSAGQSRKSDANVNRIVAIESEMRTIRTEISPLATAWRHVESATIVSRVVGKFAAWLLGIGASIAALWLAFKGT